MTTILEKLLSETEDGRRELCRQQLLVNASDQIWEVLDQEKISCAELADRLGTSASNVSQMLSGRRNITLKTIADMAYELGYSARVHLRKDGCGAAVLPAKWTLYKSGLKSVAEINGPAQIDKFEYDVGDMSVRNSNKAIPIDAIKSATA